MRKTVDYLVVIAVACCVFATGGFRWQQCIIPIVFLCFALVVMAKRVNVWAVFVAMGIIIFSAISVFNTQGNFQNSIYETEKFLLFPLALILGTVVDKRTIKNGVYMAALMVAVVGLIAYCGFANINDFVIRDNGILRLQSLLRYANTTACLIGCGYFVAITMYSETQQKIHLYLSSVMLFAMFLTVSKATIPIFMLIATFLVYKNKNVAVNFLIQNVFAAIFLVPVMLFAKNYMYFLAAVLIVVYVVISVYKPRFLSERFACKLWIIAIIIGVIGASLLSIIKPTLLSTFSQRLIYMKDSLKLLPRNIIFGTGPGSWKVLQYGIQSTQYDVAYIHNGFLQFLIENGIVVAVGFVVICGLAIWCSIKQKYYDLGAAILLIALHSMVDFDFSFGIVLILMGLMCGATVFAENKQRGKNLLQYVSCVMIFVAVVNSVYMSTEYILRHHFEKLCLLESYDDALVQAEKLEGICPQDSSLKMNMAAIIEKVNNDKVAIKKKIDEARKLSPYDPEIFKGYMIYNVTEENVENLCKEYIDMKPRHESTYTELKGIVENAYKSGAIARDKKNNVITRIDEIRFNNKVYDRNELLDRIIRMRSDKK